MSEFAKHVQQEQVEWRRKFLPQTKEWGSWRGVPREHLLQPGDWEENLWEGIRKGSDHSLISYLNLPGNEIQPHTGKHHLNSSWVLCANLYFPFRRNNRAMDLIAGFLKNEVHNDIAAVCGIELEFELQGDLHPSILLGEKDGCRGKGQTSPDVAFVIKTNTGANGLVLVESKYAEHSFYECSAYTSKVKQGRDPNPDRKRCEDIKGLLNDSQMQCHQVAWKRRYWEQLAVNQSAMLELQCCPAAKGGYQLLRQQALAEGIARSGRFAPVISCVAYDPRNTSLLQSLKRLGITDWTDSWGGLFEGKACFRSFTHQAWVAWVRDHDCGGEWQDWLSYIRTRYGYGE